MGSFCADAAEGDRPEGKDEKKKCAHKDFTPSGAKPSRITAGSTTAFAAAGALFRPGRKEHRMSTQTEPASSGQLQKQRIAEGGKPIAGEKNARTMISRLRGVDALWPPRTNGNPGRYPRRNRRRLSSPRKRGSARLPFDLSRPFPTPFHRNGPCITGLKNRAV